MLSKQDILEKKQHGDLKSAGEMLGISGPNAYAALSREGSKHHKAIKKILSQIIETREMISREVAKEQIDC